MSEYIFKTIYFPKDRVRSGASARISISVSPNERGGAFAEFFRQLSSRSLRLAIGDPYLEDIEAEAASSVRSVSGLIARKLLDAFDSFAPALNLLDGSVGDSRLKLSIGNQPGSGSSEDQGAPLGLTFRDSLRQSVYGWYPYVEGFDATYTRDAILRYKPRTVYDPFGGSGTTQLAASCLGVPSFYSEVNPFMRFVSETKTTAAAWGRANPGRLNLAITSFKKFLSSRNLQAEAAGMDLTGYFDAFPGRDFFQEKDIRLLLAATEHVRNTYSSDEGVRDLLLLACAANAVRSSNMVRRADLRRRRADEYKNREVDVSRFLAETVDRYARDVMSLPVTMAPVTFVSEDAREIADEFRGSFDFALTSPPYLNGTNYFRNTKIELWLLGFIRTELDIAEYRRKAITAGINNVGRHGGVDYSSPDIDTVANLISGAGGDRRIPVMVRQYFSDMHQMFTAVHRSLATGGRFLLDIGDSKFYGVHVPTDRLLVETAASAGFKLESSNVLARRHSRDKSELVQVELVLQKLGRASLSRRVLEPGTAGDISEIAGRFQKELPFKEPPYSKRNWGHPLHSLCSYQGKLKPSIAHWLVREFVPPGGRVLDPLGGVGTIPFEAALSGREAVSNDMSPFASTVARAKLAPPVIDRALGALEDIWSEASQHVIAEHDLSDADFGLNGSVSEFFHENTLAELLKLRSVFRRRGVEDDASAFVWASLLHILHGNRPYALSRTSHPITPFYPSGDFIYKNVKEKIESRIIAALRTPLPSAFRPGQGLFGDFRLLEEGKVGRFDSIITSPPFMGMRFDRPNWMRLWFCGWAEQDFLNRSLGFLERQQVKSVDVYGVFFSKMKELIRPTGTLIIHIGGGKGVSLPEQLIDLASADFRLVAQVSENVQAVEQHGIRDKGLTTHHHLLFFSPR